MMKPSGLFLSLLVAALLGSGMAQACSVSADYRIPTTLELVEQADAVVIARVADGGASDEPGFRYAALVPITLIKGERLPSTIWTDDLYLTTDTLRTTPSDPRSIAGPHPDVFAGGCNRYAFDKGSTLVAFLKRADDGYRVYAPAFSRALEDVPSPDALWVKAVRLYVDIASYPEPVRAGAVETLKRQLRQNTDDADAGVLVADMEAVVGR